MASRSSTRKFNMVCCSSPPRRWVSVGNGANTVGPACCVHDRSLSMLGMPRLASYQAARPAGSLARKKKPPMPVTRCIVAPYTLRAARKRRRALGVAYVLPMRPAEAVCGPRRNRQDWCRRPLDEGTADAATSGAAGGYAQGMLHDGERPRTPRLAGPRAVLRRLAGLPRDLR